MRFTSEHKRIHAHILHQGNKPLPPEPGRRRRPARPPPLSRRTTVRGRPSQVHTFLDCPLAMTRAWHRPVYAVVPTRTGQPGSGTVGSVPAQSSWQSSSHSGLSDAAVGGAAAPPAAGAAATSSGSRRHWRCAGTVASHVLAVGALVQSV